MKLSVSALALCLSAASASSSHSRQLLSARSSSGCGSSSSLTPGTTTALSGTFDGTKRTFRVYVPSGYNSDTATPLVVSTHGWGGSGKQDESGSGLTKVGGGFLAVFPDGYADNSKSGSWGSWNCVGSTQSPGDQGQTCTSSADPTNGYCYTSCNGCAGADGCDWTTCLSDITPTGVGTTDVTGFIPQLYDYMEENFCVDTTREYHTGFSNGGMFTYQAGASMSSRLAAIVPVAGSFHPGFLQAPFDKVPLMDIHGTKDTTVPANTTTSGDGWKYEKVNSQIVPEWAKANGCASPTASPYTKSLGISASTASSKGLGCVDWGCDVVSCAWTGSHAYFGSSLFGGGDDNGKLVWSFLSQYSKPNHIGKGLTVGQKLPADYKLLLHNVTVVNESDQEDTYLTTSIDIASTKDFTFGPQEPVSDADANDGLWRTHYGNPQERGCRLDEDKIVLSNGAVNGSVCAPRRRVRSLGETEPVEDDAAAVALWHRSCFLGGMEANPQNGCPTDLPSVNSGGQAAYPQCSLDTNSKSELSATGHCFLTCDPCRNNGLDMCDDDAHEMCPEGAACVTGFLKNIKQGVCLYNSGARPQKYHLAADPHCYEMVYHDDFFAGQGYVVGACASSYNSVDSVTTEVVCSGDAGANIKTCPDSQVEVSIATKGKTSA